MKHSLRTLLAIPFALIVVETAYSQLVVTANNNATALATKIAGPGVTISGASITTYGTATGTFTQTGTNLGIDSGILLTSGSVIYAVGPNSNGFSGTSNGGAGYSKLTALAGSTTYDAVRLEFDLTNTSDTLKVNYVFASEEYNDYVGTAYNDIFAIFLTGPGYPVPTNVAKVPGTNVPVAINNVNCGANSGYYKCNDPWAPYSGSCTTECPLSSGSTTIGYDGFTKLMEVKAVVTSCSSYHVVMAIADAVDAAYDSGVFFKAGSFTSVGNCTLPITLTNFDAVKAKDDAILSWETSSEFNSSYFAIERSLDGQQFEEIGKVMSAGQSQTAIDYSFIDQDINKFSVRKIYYRLRLNDLDQSYKYSEVRLIDIDINNGMPKVFPNPFNNLLTIQCNNSLNEATKVQLTHISGKIILEKYFDPESSSLTLDDLSSLSNGLYFLRITSGSNVVTQKLMKED